MKTFQKLLRDGQSTEASSKFEGSYLVSRRKFVRDTAILVASAVTGITGVMGPNTSAEAYPVIVNNSLFWTYNNQTTATWLGLCGDQGNADIREKHIQWCSQYGCNAVVLCLNNDRYMSLFLPTSKPGGGYMHTLDMVRVNMVKNYVYHIVHDLRGKVFITFFDCPEDKNGQYYPTLSCWDRHEAFIRTVCQDPVMGAVDGYLIGCETERSFSTQEVETLIGITKKYTNKPVGSHEDLDLNMPSQGGRRWAGNADFISYELWNPYDGRSKQPQQCVDQILNLQRKLRSLGFRWDYPIWAGEWNIDPRSALSISQAQAMAAIPYVNGIGEPLR